MSLDNSSNLFEFCRISRSVELKGQYFNSLVTLSSQGCQNSSEIETKRTDHVYLYFLDTDRTVKSNNIPHITYF